MKRVLILLLVFSSAAWCQGPNNARMLSGVNAQTGTSYIFVAADTTRVVTFSNSSAVAVTLPNGAAQGFGAGTMLTVVNLGTGLVTITCSNCTINGLSTMQLAQNQATDIYGGAGNPAVNYVAVNPALTFNAAGTGNFLGSAVQALIQAPSSSSPWNLLFTNSGAPSGSGGAWSANTDGSVTFTYSYDGTIGHSGGLDFNADGSIDFSSADGSGAAFDVSTNGSEVTNGPLCITNALNTKACINAASTGTPNTVNLPTLTGASGQFLATDGGSPQQTSWKTIGSECGTVSAGGACANTTTASPHCVSGIATLSGGTSTITGISPAFTSSTSYTVITNDQTTIANPSKGIPAGGSSITFTGTGTDNIGFIACGG